MSQGKKSQVGAKKKEIQMGESGGKQG